MEGKKQTAVEWLMDQITYDESGQRLASFKEGVDLHEFFQKAIQMEKEKRMEAVKNALYAGFRHQGDKKAEDYMKLQASYLGYLERKEKGEAP
jgi:hypothetical protein